MWSKCRIWAAQNFSKKLNTQATNASKFDDQSSFHEIYISENIWKYKNFPISRPLFVHYFLKFYPILPTFIKITKSLMPEQKLPQNLRPGQKLTLGKQNMVHHHHLRLLGGLPSPLSISHLSQENEHCAIFKSLLINMLLALCKGVEKNFHTQENW